MEGKNKGLHMITFLLVIIGGLNWLLVGLIGWDIGALFGGTSALISRIIYIVVGLSAIYEIATHKNRCRECGDNMKSAKPMGGTMPPAAGPQ